MDTLFELVATTAETVIDVLPIATIIVFFQVVVIRRKLQNIARLAIGFVYVLIGLSLFLVGLEKALFPVGRLMATQLTDLNFILGDSPLDMLHWSDYYWIYIFAFCIGAKSCLLSSRIKTWSARGRLKVTTISS